MFRYLKVARKILGMNARNLEYIRPYNKRRAVRLADNKLKTKRVLGKIGIPVPGLYKVIRNRLDLERFDWESLPRSFVLKPNTGLGGEGIMVVYGRKKNGNWINASGQELSIADFKAHIRDILDGRYSISGDPDIAFFEERLKKTKKFRRLCYKGTPDIRIIVHNKVPVMAMMRLPTKHSEGKANLHLGGVGVGVNISTGITKTAIQYDRIINTVPGTNRILSGIKIPHWQQILKLAVEAQVSSRLGFLGADVVLDRNRGPVLLELNARPGLSIQIANLSPLKERLERIKGLKIATAEKGLRVARELFGEEIYMDTTKKSGKKIISTIEPITLIAQDKTKIKVEAKIDTGAGYSSISTELASRLGLQEALDAINQYPFNTPLAPKKARALAQLVEEEVLDEFKQVVGTIIIHSSHGTTYRVLVPLTFILGDLKVKTRVSIVKRKHLKYPMIVGRKDLKNFLVDPHKKPKS